MLLAGSTAIGRSHSGSIGIGWRSPAELANGRTQLPKTQGMSLRGTATHWTVKEPALQIIEILRCGLGARQ